MKTSLVQWNVSAAKAHEAEQERSRTCRKSWMARLGKFLDRFAPVGYEDAEGFHYGNPSVPPKNDWLS